MLFSAFLDIYWEISELSITLKLFLIREKYREVVFVYISDDLEWGKRMIKKKAERRKINIYFVGDDKETKERDRNR